MRKQHTHTLETLNRKSISHASSINPNSVLAYLDMVVLLCDLLNPENCTKKICSITHHGTEHKTSRINNSNNNKAETKALNKLQPLTHIYYFFSVSVSDV